MDVTGSTHLDDDQYKSRRFLEGITDAICVFFLVNPKSGGNAAAILLDTGFNFAQFKDDRQRRIKVVLADIRKGKPGEKRILHIARDVLSVKQANRVVSDPPPSPDVYVLVAGGDGTVMWAVDEIEKVGIPEEDVIIGVIPFGTGNDLANTMQSHPVVRLPGEDPRDMIRRLTLMYLEFQPTWFDIWKLEIRLMPNGRFKKIDSESRQKTVIYDPLDSSVPATRLTFSLCNYFSLGVESRIGVGFDRNRTASRFWNKTRYALEGVKKSVFQKTVRVDQLLLGMSELTEPQYSSLKDSADGSHLRSEIVEAAALLANPTNRRKRDKLKAITRTISLGKRRGLTQQSATTPPRGDVFDELLSVCQRNPIFRCVGQLKVRVLFPSMFACFSNSQSFQERSESDSLNEDGKLLAIADQEQHLVAQSDELIVHDNETDNEEETLQYTNVQSVPVVVPDTSEEDLWFEYHRQKILQGLSAARDGNAADRADVPFLKPAVSLIILNIPSFGGGLDIWSNAAGKCGLMTSQTLNNYMATRQRQSFRAVRERPCTSTTVDAPDWESLPGGKTASSTGHHRYTDVASSTGRSPSSHQSRECFRLSAKVYAESDDRLPQPQQSVIASAVQNVGDGKLEFVSFRSTVEIGVANLAMMAGAYSTSGWRVHQGKGPFVLDFNDDLPDSVRMYFQIDGEFFIANQPKEVVILHNKRIKMLSNPHSKYSRNMAPCT